jgi:hypothetical protein
MALPRDKEAFEQLNEAFARMARAGGFAASSFGAFAKFYADSISGAYEVDLTDEAWGPNAKQLAAVSRVQNETRQVFDCEECTNLARTVWVPRLCARRG